MKLAFHHRLAWIIFWFAQAVAIISVLALNLFIGGSLIDEMLNKIIDYRADYMVFFLFFFEVLMAVFVIISWYRKRPGAVLIIVLTVLISIWWGREDISLAMIHLPLLFSGLLLLFYSYYKEWILKKKV